MSAAGFAHEALVYRDATSFVDGAAPYLREGARAGESVFAVLPAEGVKLLREALGETAERVRFLDMAEVGHNPARIIPALRGLVDEAGERPVRGLTEPAFRGRPAEELAEALLHEALVNVAFADSRAFRLLCPYDGAGVDGEVLGAAERTHSALLESGKRRPCAGYDPARAATEFGAALPERAEVSDVVHFTLDDLPELRDLVGVRAAAFGVPREHALDLMLATNEVVTNSICHGGERGTLRLWTDGESLVCEVSDGGHITEPLVGRIAPVPSVQGGRGVWLANQLCDLVRIRSTAAGTVVRLHVRR